MTTAAHSPFDNSKFTAISADAYEKFLMHLNKTQLKPPTPQAGIGLEPNTAEGRSIEVMCASLSVAILEVLAGRRPASQVSKWFSRECYTKLNDRAEITKEAMLKRYAHLPVNHSPFAKNLALPTVRRSRAQKVARHAYEVCVVIQDSQRVRSIALRVEKSCKAWRIVELEIG